MALNRITLYGRMCKDPELKRFESGTAVTTFTLAVERDFKNKQTGTKDVDFINCVAYKNQAEHIKTYFSKGMATVVDGRLQIRQYQDKEGNNRYLTEVIVNNIYFGESKKAQQTTSESTADQWEELDDNGSLPFD